MQLAERLFAELSLKTRKGVGIERDSYGAGEQAAHDLMRVGAQGLGLEVSVDAIGNLMMKKPGGGPAGAGHPHWIAPGQRATGRQL